MKTPKFVEVSFDVDKTLFRQPALTQAARGLGIGKEVGRDRRDVSEKTDYSETGSLATVSASGRDGNS